MPETSAPLSNEMSSPDDSLSRLKQQLAHREAELAILGSVQSGLAAHLEVQAIYDLVGDGIRDLFDSQVVMISTYDPSSQTVEHRYAIERGERIHAPGPRPPGGFRTQIIETRRSMLVNSNVEELAARLDQPTIPGTLTPKSWLGVPMLVGGHVIGILSLQDVERENAFTESDVRLLETVAASMSVALENARLWAQEKQIAVLEERQRLGRELHDSVTQSLYGISLYAQAAAGHLALEHYDQVDKYLDEISASSQEALAEIRLLLYRLRPPVLENEGLVAALQQRLASVEGRAGRKADLKTDLSARLPLDVEEGLYYIAQEALNNALKHAHARSVRVSLLQHGHAVALEVTDDGVGFKPADAGAEGKMGLPCMQERAAEIGGKLTLASEPGNGTTIRVEVEV
ncbi:MAG: GAF domain-containing sensor histidine kinase, partial [Anaerolineales bacterium]